jgi:hypothetical protein
MQRMERQGTRRGHHDRRVPVNNHARIFPPLARALGWTGTDQNYGLNTHGSLAKYDRTSRSWKTCQRSLFGGLIEFSPPYPKSGMTRNGRMYGPATWERPTGENGSGLWRTPSAADGTGGSMSGGQAAFLLENDMARNSGSKAQVCLRDQVRHPLLFPTPQGRDYRSGSPGRAVLEGKQRNLNDVVKLFPTPCAQDYKHRGPNSRQKGLPDVLRSWPMPTAGDYKDGSPLSCANVPAGGLPGRAVHTDRSGEGQLSASWVEALMGYPGGWTDRDTDSLFENRFPQSWRNGTWEDGIARTATKQKHRRSRIEALGNSIVPQIPYLMFLLPEFDAWRGGSS